MAAGSGGRSPSCTRSHRAARRRPLTGSPLAYHSPVTRPAVRARDWRHDPETERRVEALVAAMSPEEKVDLVTGDQNFDYAFYNAPIERLGIPALTMADGPAGSRVNDRTVNGGRSTALPAPIALAATWDPELAGRYGDLIGAEAFATGHNVQLAPAVDIARAPRGGRTFESFGEDPLLQARMVAPEIQGIQSHAVQATIKHFIANNQEYRRFTIDVRIDERTLHEIYLPPFDAAVREGAVAAAMGSFNRVNGTYASEHPHLLTELLRGELGFRGWVMSDYEATWSTAESAQAGLDQEQPAGRFWGERLLQAVDAGEVEAAMLDEMVRRILRPMIGLGQLERPVEIRALPVEAHARTAREIAERGIVLLKNEADLLPLEPMPSSIAVIGPEADNASTAGGGSGWVYPIHETSPLDGIRRRAGEGVRVAYAPGTIRSQPPPSSRDRRRFNRPSCRRRTSRQTGRGSWPSTGRTRGSKVSRCCHGSSPRPRSILASSTFRSSMPSRPSCRRHRWSSTDASQCAGPGG